MKTGKKCKQFVQKMKIAYGSSGVFHGHFFHDYDQEAKKRFHSLGMDIDNGSANDYFYLD